MARQFSLIIIVFSLIISKTVFSQVEVGAGVESNKLFYDVGGSMILFSSFSIFADYSLEKGSEIEGKITKDTGPTFGGFSIEGGWHRNFTEKFYSIVRLTFHSNEQVGSISFLTKYKSNIFFLGAGIGMEVRKEIYFDLVYNLPLERKKWVNVSVPSGRVARYLESMIKLTFRIGWSL